MRRFSRQEYLFMALLGLIFLVLMVLSLFLIEGGRRRNLLVLEYEAEKIATALWEQFREEGSIDEGLLGSEILGFGIYQPSGRALLYSGNAPSYLDPPARDLGSLRFRFNPQGDTLILIRPLGFLPERMMMRMHGTRSRHGMMGRQSAPSQFIFLELSIQEYGKRLRYYRAGLIGVPGFMAALMLLVGYLYRKNSQYRKKIASQRQLVQLGEIARTLAHEIKNPLSAIRIQTGILRKTASGDKGTELRIIEEEVQRLRLLTDRIGEFLKNPQGHPEPIQVDQFLGDLRMRFGQNVQFNGPVDPAGRIRFDRARLRSVLENLIRNALESGPDGSPVELHWSHSKSKVTISVLDRGRGLPEELQDRIFDPFVTNKVQGSGIGLTISRRFVEAAGGTLSLLPRKGGGTEALIILEREDE